MAVEQDNHYLPWQTERGRASPIVRNGGRGVHVWAAPKYPGCPVQSAGGDDTRSAAVRAAVENESRGADRCACTPMRCWRTVCASTALLLALAALREPTEWFASRDLPAEGTNAAEGKIDLGARLVSCRGVAPPRRSRVIWRHFRHFRELTHDASHTHSHSTPPVLTVIE